MILFIFHFTNPANFSTHQTHQRINNKTHTKNLLTVLQYVPNHLSTITLTPTPTTMPLLSVSNNVTVTELFNGSAMFGRPSKKKGAGWIVTGGKGNAIIQKQTSNDDSTSANASVVFVVRWENYMGSDGLNGRILPGLPIHRCHDSVYFKTSSTTTLGNRYKAPFCFKFETVDDAEEFEAFWLLKNGSIALWKKQDAKKKEDIINPTIKVPLQDSTNENTVHTGNAKRKAVPMIDGPLRTKKKVEGRTISNSHSSGLMPNERIINGKARKILKAKRSALKSITEDSIVNLNEEDKTDLNDDNSIHSNDDNKDDSLC
jgi:hypothetical protein